MTGVLLVPTPGQYLFKYEIDDRFRFYFDDKLVFDSSGDAGPRTPDFRFLSAGLHAVRFDYVNEQKDANLKLRWKREGAPYWEDPIAAGLFFPSMEIAQKSMDSTVRFIDLPLPQGRDPKSLEDMTMFDLSTLTLLPGDVVAVVDRGARRQRPDRSQHRPDA